jgi:hypothetical protein
MIAVAALLAAASVQVTGDVPKSGALAQPDLEALGAVTLTWKLHGEDHEVVGVPLSKVLEKFGFEPGPMGGKVAPADKRAGWKKVLIASAPDGFQAVFSCAELFESMGATRALLIWKMDGKPLEGLRVVVLTDKEPSRAIRDVARLEVRDLRAKAN